MHSSQQRFTQEGSRRTESKSQLHTVVMKCYRDGTRLDKRRFVIWEGTGINMSTETIAGRHKLRVIPVVITGHYDIPREI